MTGTVMFDDSISVTVVQSYKLVLVPTGVCYDLREVPNAWGPRTKTPRAISELLVRLLADNAQEHFGALYVNNNYFPIGHVLLHVGSIDQVQIDIPTILVPGIQLMARGLILFHNHPWSSEYPSPADENTTERIRDAADLVGLTLLDHVVVSRHGCKRAQRQD